MVINDEKPLNNNEYNKLVRHPNSVLPVSPKRYYRCLAPSDQSSGSKTILFLSAGNVHIEEFFMHIGEEIRRNSHKVFYICGMQDYTTPRDPERFFNIVWWKDLDNLISMTKEISPDLICIWNGSHPLYRDKLSIFLNHFSNVPHLFSELGWFSQKDSLVFDWQGVNGASRISSIEYVHELAEERNIDVDFDHFRNDFICDKIGSPYSIKNDDYIFVPLQLSNDTNIVCFSPFFKDMNLFVRFLSNFFPEKKLICRPHPLNTESLDDLQNLPNVEVATHGNLYEYLIAAKSIIGLNSTVLLEALLCKKKVAILAKGILSGKNDLVLDCSRDITKLAHLSSFTPNFDIADKFLDCLIKQFQVSYTNPSFAEIANQRAIKESGVFS